MTAKVISKVLEINNCNKDLLLKSIYKSKIWEEISPVSKMEAKFVAPNVMYTYIIDEIKLTIGDFLKVPIEMEGELVLIDKGEQEGKGRLIEFNIRKNKDITKLEGNIRIRALSNNKTKVGVFIHNFSLSNNFFSLFGSAAELILRTKITGILRNLEKCCKTKDLKCFI
ncbi:MAG: hypothetical protein ACFE8A_15050 [Candidatus Hodarchaeota archaeon]